jgi:hypothetical protein
MDLKGTNLGMRKDKRKGMIGVLKLAAGNVRGLGTKETKLVFHLKEREINIAAITEMKKKLTGTKEIGDYTMIYRGVPRNRSACCVVGLLIDKEWKTKIQSYIFINERIVIARFKINRGHLTVIGVMLLNKVRLKKLKYFMTNYKNK